MTFKTSAQRILAMCAPIHSCKWATRSQGLLDQNSRNL